MTNNTQNQNKTNTTTKESSFEALLKMAFGKERNMGKAINILKAATELHEKLNEEFDLILNADLQITECPCANNCGSVKVTIPFTAMKFMLGGPLGGINIVEGESTAIISPQKK